MRLYDDAPEETLLHAEYALLGSCIIGGLGLTSLYLDALDPDAYSTPPLAILAGALLRMAADSKGIDLVTVCHHLRDHDHRGTSLLDMVGGEDFVIEVAESTPSIHNAAHYAEIVKERLNRRRIFSSAKELAESAKNPDCTMAEIIAKAQEVSHSSSKLLPRSVFAHISEIAIDGDKERGIPTGIDGLDSQITMGGFPEGQLSLVRAYHKGGKSTFLIQSALAAANQGYKVLYATFADLNRKHIKRRMMRMLTGFQEPPSSASLFDEWTQEHERLNSLDIDVYDVAETDGCGSVEEFVAWAESNMRTGNGWDAVYVDYAQELTSSSRRIHGKIEEQMECARVLNRFATHGKIATIVGSQITTDQQGQRRTKWGRDWEEKAGWVLSLNPPTHDPMVSTVEISYSRFGPQKPRSTDIPVRFNSSLLVLEEVT